MLPRAVATHKMKWRTERISAYLPVVTSERRPSGWVRDRCTSMIRVRTKICAAIFVAITGQPVQADEPNVLWGRTLDGWIAALRDKTGRIVVRRSSRSATSGRRPGPRCRI